MTTITVQVDNEQNAVLLEKMLKALSFVEDVDIKNNVSGMVEEPKGSYKKLKKILDKTEAETLFTNIKNPSDWQKDLRDEWERNL
ncbi:hypothetical protein [Pedobacter paludis]|uniref:Uncharacterized protein n=1 Tax=Pedobacter paludis TaxID=2203212 RepID=A0A317EWK8_9SPHI|nr:hypothetical protein [Pedobacter paludis]PWS31340.1 hypothetical protein DF947_12095 [Pedobacter paludis]